METNVSSPVSGKIVSIEVEQGLAVTSGQLLLVIEKSN